MSEAIKDKPRKSSYVPGTLYDKNPKTGKKVKFKETDNTTIDVNPIKFIEKHYPETAKEFQNIQAQQYLTFCKKQMDYGPSNISMGTGVGEAINVKLATTALVIRINDKIQRLLNLVVTNDRDAQNEPVEDAFQDLSVYGIIAQIVRNGKWGI